MYRHLKTKKVSCRFRPARPVSDQPGLSLRGAKRLACHCEEQSAATKQSQILRQRDCFAALAMTQVAACGPGARSPPPAGIQGKISSQLWKCEENEEEGRISRSVFGHRL